MRFKCPSTPNIMAVDLLADVDSKFWTKGRLKTYIQWPFTTENDTCTPERMAAAGFYVVGGNDEPDTVECFVCAKQLDGWDATDDPWQEHANHQKDCPYVLLNKQDETLWTIDDLFSLYKVYNVKQCARNVDEAVKIVKMKSLEMTKDIPKIYKHERKSRKLGK